MTWLKKIREKKANTSGRTNIVIVPGNNCETLADQTCSHFPNWLDDIVASKNRSTAIWIFRHDIQIDRIASWFAYCEAGEHLLRNLTSMQNDDGLSDDDTLILVGHRLGSFMLKKALLDAHRSSHHPHMDALLNTIETLVMLGDPDLNSGNQSEWISLISKCLPCKTLPKHLDCSEDARCLQHVAGCFEEFTLHSNLFQVSSVAELKRKHFLKIRSEDHRCIFSASMTVRMWTTTSEEITIRPGEGDKKNCAFYPKSPLYSHLVSIPDSAAQSSIIGLPTSVEIVEGQTKDGRSTCLSMDEPVMDVTCHRPAPSEATFLTMPGMPVIETVSVTTVQSVSGPDTTSASSVDEEAGFTSHSDDHSDPTETQSDSLTTVATEDSPHYDLAIKSSEATSSEQAIHEGLVDSVAQQCVSESTSIMETPRVARRSPFFHMHIPRRDAQFFGREELLASLKTVLTPTPLPPSSRLTTRDSGTVSVLRGAPGVGKSALALELTYRAQATFDHTFWLRANSKIHLAQSFHQAAESLGLVQHRGDHDHESSRQKFMGWLNSTSSKWLLILDDADDLRLLSDFMPRQCRGSIIVTSRQPISEGLDILFDPCMQTFQVEPFTVEDATRFICSLAPSALEAADPELDLATLTTVAENCDCLPLTLRRVAMIINRLGSMQDKRINGMLEKHASLSLVSQPSSPLIYGSLSSASLALVTVIAFLDPYCIDDATLLGAQRYKGIPLSAFPFRDDGYFDAKNELMVEALLAVGATSSAISIHRVTAALVRANLNPKRFRDGFHSACRILEAQWPSRRKMKNIVLGNWPEFDALHCHIHRLSRILVKDDRERGRGFVKYGLANDSYLKSLLLSTWYNACRGNAREDQALIRLAHTLIARSQLSDMKSPYKETFSTPLPARLIDVGVDNTQPLRLVDTAGEIGCYVALSHCRSARSSSETQLTMSNMIRLMRSIEPSELPRSVFDAINFTRSLGVRYIWIDSLCVVEGDQEGLLEMSDIYRSAIGTIVATGPVDTKDMTEDSCVNTTILHPPFSIFLDWSRPTVARSFSNRVFFLHQSVAIFLTSFLDQSPPVNKIRTALRDRGQVLGAVSEEILQIETDDARVDEASSAIDQGVHHVESGQRFEALAFFMKAREAVSAFQTITPRSWQIHAVASANIACVYQMQHLPGMALEIAEASLAFQSRIPEISPDSTLGQLRLHFVMGGIHNALGDTDQSLNHYNLAAADLAKLPDDQKSPSQQADWKAVLDLKLAQHHLRTKNHKEAHALLQQSLSHFQSQETPTAQAHLARTLHWQSIAFEAQGSRAMGNAMSAAARQAWLGVREAKGEGAPAAVNNVLSTEDFDAEVEFWFR